MVNIARHFWKLLCQTHWNVRGLWKIGP